MFLADASKLFKNLISSISRYSETVERSLLSGLRGHHFHGLGRMQKELTVDCARSCVCPTSTDTVLLVSCKWPIIFRNYREIPEAPVLVFLAVHGTWASVLTV